MVYAVRLARSRVGRVAARVKTRPQPARRAGEWQAAFHRPNSKD
jgi:hypothetical protein